jgi:site-specific DNA recombinase
MIRAAIYARYSSDLQNPKSIEDQIRLAREHAARTGMQVIGEYSDAAISGSLFFERPGIQRLMKDAKAGRFDVVLTEALDRISRDQEHTAGLYKRLTHAFVRMVSLTRRRDRADMHVGFKGTADRWNASACLAA